MAKEKKVSGDGLGATLRLFLKLGFIAFGGPSAHIAMLEDEVVSRRGWLKRQHFLDLVGATNLIPGPNSTEMMMHVGWERHRWPGLLGAALCFILPAAGLSALCAWLYMRYGELPAVSPMLFGIKPAILAVILAAVWKLGKTAVKDWRYGALGLLAAATVLAGVGEVPVLLGASLIGTLWLRFLPRGPAVWVAPVALLGLKAAVGAAGDGVSLLKLSLFFAKVGAILYGSGYVLVAFLEGGLVERYGWLTSEQLLDAVAIGQFTPGPVLSTATFIGFLLAGPTGAAAATVAIFAPSIVFVRLLNPLVPRLRQSPWASAFLDSVNVAAVGLMGAVMLQLAAMALSSWMSWAIAVLAAAALFRWKLGSAWLVLGGALLGYLFRWTVGIP